MSELLQGFERKSFVNPNLKDVLKILLKDECLSHIALLSVFFPDFTDRLFLTLNAGGGNLGYNRIQSDRITRMGRSPSLKSLLNAGFPDYQLKLMKSYGWYLVAPNTEINSKKKSRSQFKRKLDDQAGVLFLEYYRQYPNSLEWTVLDPDLRLCLLPVITLYKDGHNLFPVLIHQHRRNPGSGTFRVAFLRSRNTHNFLDHMCRHGYIDSSIAKHVHPALRETKNGYIPTKHMQDILAAVEQDLGFPVFNLNGTYFARPSSLVLGDRHVYAARAEYIYNRILSIEDHEVEKDIEVSIAHMPNCSVRVTVLNLLTNFTKADGLIPQVHKQKPYLVILTFRSDEHAVRACMEISENESYLFLNADNNGCITIGNVGKKAKLRLKNITATLRRKIRNYGYTLIPGTGVFGNQKIIIPLALGSMFQESEDSKRWQIMRYNFDQGIWYIEVV